MTMQLFLQRVRYAENNPVQIDWVSFDAAPPEQVADSFKHIARAIPIFFYASQSLPRLIMIRWRPSQPPQRRISVCHDGGQRLTYFMSDRDRHRLCVQQPIVSLALQHGVRPCEARFTGSPLGKEASEHLGADRRS